MHDYRTLKYMSHIVETDLYDENEKERLLDFIDYTEEISKAAKEAHDKDTEKIWTCLKLPEQATFF